MGTLTVKGGTLTVVGGSGGASTGPIDRINAALALASSQPVRGAFTGSSTTEGNNATSAANRYVNRLVAAMQAAYPSGGSESSVVASTAASFGTLSTANGIHGYNAGEGGTTAATYLTSAERTAIAALNPRFVLHMIGSNDYQTGVAVATYKTNVLAALADLKAKITVPCVHILVHAYARFDTFTPVAPWADYGTALAQIAAADPTNVVFVDLSRLYVPLGIPGADPADLIDTDSIHQKDAGHQFMAESLRVALRIPQPATVTPPADTTAPSVPTGLTIGAVTATTVPLTWTASTDAVGVTGYRVRRGGTLVGSPTGTSFTDTGRAAATQYSYTVSAVDAAGNESAQTGAVTATTSATTDSTAPSVPTGLTVGTPTATTVPLSWTASTDNVAVTGYKVRRGGTVVGTPTGTTYTDTGLTASTAYSYTVSAVDAAGNESAQTTAVPATTAAASTLVADNFNRADAQLHGSTTSTGGATWTTIVAGTAGAAADQVLIVGQAAQRTSAASNGGVSYVNVGASDCTIEVTVTALNAAAASRGGGPAVRVSTDGSFFWLNTRVNSTTQGWGLYRQDAAGSAVLVASNAGVTPTIGDRVRLVCSGATITAFVNGTQVLQVTDATLNQTSQLAGMYFNFSGGDTRMDDFARTA